MIRLTCSDRDAKITFDFAKNFSDRDAIRDALNELRERGANMLASARQESTTNTNPDNKNNSQNGSKTSKPVPLPPAKPLSPEEKRWRQLLLAHKEVRKLHTKVVLTGAVSDEKFWVALKYRYGKDGKARASRGLSKLDTEDETIDAEREQGVPSDAYMKESKQGIDVSGWNGIPTPSQRHAVFMEHPAVGRARTDKVPKEMSEEEFWDVFQASSMVVRRGRNRISKTDTTRMAEADAVFAPYQAQEKETAKMERSEKVKGLAMDLDLDRFDDHRGSHVMEGHAVGGDAPRQMREQGKGNGKGALSEGLRLMKQMNRHGQLILESKGRVGNWKEQSMKGRPLEDLEEEQERKFAKLDVTSPEEKEVLGDRSEIDREQVRRMAMGLREWDVQLSAYGMVLDGSGAIMSKLLDRMKL